MLRLLISLCFFVISAGQAWAQLVTPPDNARRFAIVSAAGPHGYEAWWATPDGVRWSRSNMVLRGLIYDFDQQMKLGADGLPESITIRGETPEGNAAETFAIAAGRATWKSPVDAGAAAANARGFYSSFGGTTEGGAAMAEALLKAPNKTLPLWPSGQASIEPLTTAKVSVKGETKALTAYALVGVGLSPFPIWFEGERFFANIGSISVIPAGWESTVEQLSKAQDDALAARAPAVYAKIARTPALPIAFQNVRLFDAEAGVFRDAMTVLVESGKITAVGPAATTLLPAGAEVYQGGGRTLIPGLWDNHMHFGDDSSGPLLLSLGITNVRDPGNQVDELLARKKRIDERQLLGPRIVPSMMIDGPGPFAAQSAVTVSTRTEAIAAVRRAKDLGYVGIKLYGSLNPSFVKPMAQEAHKLGLRVLGHIPRTMRPLDAVRAGYDEITHINWVMMQAMPADVIKTSNGLNRFYGPAKYARDVDLQRPDMKAFLDELGRRGTAVDPTISVFEPWFTTEPGEVGPAYAPFIGTLPPVVERYTKAGGIKLQPRMTRGQTRASFAKLQALLVELHKRKLPLLAGTDGSGLELVRELELYVAAGLTPAQALQTATIGPARAYGLERETGSITVGKLADLALIDGDPSTTISALRQVEWVLRDGRIMRAADLRAAVGISGPPTR